MLALVVRRQHHGDLTRLVGQRAPAEAAPHQWQLANGDGEGLSTWTGGARSLRGHHACILASADVNGTVGGGLLPAGHRVPNLPGWSPYEITIIDVASPPADDELDELALTINTHDHAAPLLPQLPGSRVYYTGHDDCYVYVESVDPVLPARILARQLTLFAGSALLDDDADAVGIPEPDVSLTAALLQHHPHWAATVLDAQPGRTVTIGITAIERAWRLSDPTPAVTPLVITLDLGSGHWAFPPRSIPGRRA